MTDLATYERVLWRDLFKAKSAVKMYSFHEAYTLSPAQIYVFLSKYVDMGLVKQKNDEISLTAEGHKYVWRNRHKFFGNVTERPWRPVFENVPWQIAEKNMFILPHKRWVDKRVENLPKDQFIKEIRRYTGNTSD